MCREIERQSCGLINAVIADDVCRVSLDNLFPSFFMECKYQTEALIANGPISLKHGLKEDTPQ